MDKCNGRKLNIRNGSNFRIKVNKEFELWEKGVRVLGLCGNSRRCILLNWYKEGLVLDGEGSIKV